MPPRTLPPTLIIPVFERARREECEEGDSYRLDGLVGHLPLKKGALPRPTEGGGGKGDGD